MQVFLRERYNKFHVVLEYRDTLTGKKKQKTLSTHEKISAAKKALIEEKNKLNNNDMVIPKDLSFGDYMTGWVELHKSNLSITTYERYKGIIDKDIIPSIGAIDLQRLNPVHIEKFYQAMLLRLSGKTVLQYHRIIHKALDKAYKQQIINKNPADLVEAPKALKYKAAVYNMEQIRKLFYEVKNHRLEAPIHLAISLGLRAGEILGLSWDAVDFENSVITISSTLVRGKTVNEKGETVYNFKEPKSDTSNRSLPAPLGLMDMLKDYRKRQMELRLRSYGKYDNKYNLVFTQLDGSPMESNSFSRLFKTFLESRGLPHVRFHDLRHTNATIMLASNVSAKVASSRLGHSSIGITMDLYTHVLQNMEVEAAEKLNKIIYG